MRRASGYALIATYLVVQLFGQVIHAWSGCEHAHLPGHHGHLLGHAVASHSHAGGDVCHHHKSCGKPVSEDATSGEGWHDSHTHAVVHDCLLCQHLTLGQLAAPAATAAIEWTAASAIFLPVSQAATWRWLGPNSPRAPPVA